MNLKIHGKPRSTKKELAGFGIWEYKSERRV